MMYQFAGEGGPARHERHDGNPSVGASREKQRVEMLRWKGRPKIAHWMTLIFS